MPLTTNQPSDDDEPDGQTQSPYGEDDADPYAADDTKNPHEETHADDEADGDEADGDVAAAPRKRGRPRKAT